MIYDFCSKLSENLTFFILISFVFASIFGIGMGMEINDGKMSSCPFMAEHATMCQMSVTEHIAQWQQAFLGVPKGNLFMLFVWLLTIVLIPFLKLFPKIEDAIKSTKSGILNPKIY